MASEEQEEKTSLPPEEEKEDIKQPLASESAGKKEVDIPDCPVHSVVVYPDRAEVCKCGFCIAKTRPLYWNVL